MSRLLVCSSLVLSIACATPAPAAKVEAAPTAPAAPPAPKPMPPGLDESAMDLKADPCTDFYQYACGGWMAATEIPADRALYSRGFVSIAERNEDVQHQALEEAAAGKLPEGTPFAKQLGDYYAACMDEAKLEKGLPEIKAFIAKHTVVKSPKDLAKALGELHQVGIHPLFTVESMQDLKKSDEVIATIDQSGLGLPDRDYFVEKDEKKQKIREEYQGYVARMLVLLGEDAKKAPKLAEQIVALETRLAGKQQTRVERREPANLYHRWNLDGLKAKAKDFPWDAYLAALGAPKLTAFNVTSEAYAQEIAAAAKDVKPDVWKAYLTWTIVRSLVPALPKAMQDENFAFVSKNLSGAKADRPRWKKCVSYTDHDLGFALSREFVRRTFGDDGKARTNAMVQALQASFLKDLEASKWMDEATRAAAKTKLERMVGNNKIGFPDQWRDYSTLVTSRDSFLTDSLEANRFETRRELAKVGQPVDRTEWGMTPATVNAYNEPQKNEIVFPAGILQPPFFNREASDAVNFGSMGMVVGHEITHGFDDEGRQFDVDGNLKDWWSEASGKAFVEKVACVKQQFDGYTAVDDVKVKGDLTLGENVADLGGLKLAHAAMNDWFAKKGGDDGYRFTRSQQFFLGFAQSWCTKVRPETARVRAATDPHAPPYWRVNGPLGNVEAFRAAFSCNEKAPMLRQGPARCEVW
ncbi:MAG: M13 family metallopeptidase [Myxococcaceae bacterium]|nr:M13 family metallopeptidase [Myxococcaceae bacterium]